MGMRYSRLAEDQNPYLNILANTSQTQRQDTQNVADSRSQAALAQGQAIGQSAQNAVEGYMKGADWRQRRDVTAAEEGRRQASEGREQETHGKRIRAYDTEEQRAQGQIQDAQRQYAAAQRMDEMMRGKRDSLPDTLEGRQVAQAMDKGDLGLKEIEAQIQATKASAANAGLAGQESRYRIGALKRQEAESAVNKVFNNPQSQVGDNSPEVASLRKHLMGLGLSALETEDYINMGKANYKDPMRLQITAGLAPSNYMKANSMLDDMNAAMSQLNEANQRLQSGQGGAMAWLPGASSTDTDAANALKQMFISLGNPAQAAQVGNLSLAGRAQQKVSSGFREPFNLADRNAQYTDSVVSQLEAKVIPIIKAAEAQGMNPAQIKMLKDKLKDFKDMAARSKLMQQQLSDVPPMGGGPPGLPQNRTGAGSPAMAVGPATSYR